MGWKFGFFEREFLGRLSLLACEWAFLPYKSYVRRRRNSTTLVTVRFRLPAEALYPQGYPALAKNGHGP